MDAGFRLMALLGVVTIIIVQGGHGVALGAGTSLGPQHTHAQITHASEVSAPPQTVAGTLKDQALVSYLTTNGDWEWIEDKAEQYSFESSGKVSNRYEWESLWLALDRVAMYSTCPSFVGSWCQGCGAQVSEGSYSVRGTELLVRGRVVQIIKIDFGAAARGNGMGGDKIAEVRTSVERRGMVLEAAADRLVIRWADGVSTKYRKNRFPS